VVAAAEIFSQLIGVVNQEIVRHAIPGLVGGLRCFCRSFKDEQG
jgi:hypothetical protein